MKSLLNAILSASLCIFIPTTNATIVDNGIYTTDTNTGLDWLDVTETVNLSYNYVTSQLGTGGAYEGWRYATGNEFNQLVHIATGSPLIGFKLMVIDEILSDPFITLLGSTYHTYTTSIGLPPDSRTNFTSGFLADTFSLTEHWLATVDRNDHHPLNADFAIAHANPFNNSFGDYCQ